MPLLDEEGREAVVGRSRGYWLAEGDFVATLPGFRAGELGAHGFPRAWPEV